MAKKKVASVLAFIIIAALLIAFAQAQTALAAANDFSAYASQGITACSCGAAEGSITVRNTGDFENLFVISASGDAAEFVTIFPKSFTLKPGGQETAHEFVSAPCGAEREKSYVLNVDVRTDTNLQKALSQKVIVTECSNIALTLSYQNNTGCRCNKFAYFFTLNNTGSYTETYKFAVDRLAKSAYITPSETTLGSGSHEAIMLQLSPECGQPTAYFSFIASAEKSGFTASMPLRMLTNDSCYGTANYTAAPGKMFSAEKYASLLLYLPLSVLLILAVLFAAATLSRTPKPSPPTPASEKVKAKPRHYPWEQRFRAGTEKLAAGRIERAGRKEPLTVNAALAVLVIAVAAALVALVSSQLISVGKANISDASNASNATINATTNFTAGITAANVTAASITNATVTSANITAANVSAWNFTFPSIKLPNMTAIISSILRTEPNATATQRNMFAALKVPTINLTRTEKAEAHQQAATPINITGIKDSLYTMGKTLAQKLKAISQRNETSNDSAKEPAEAAEEPSQPREPREPGNESITAAMAAKTKAAASRLKSFAAAYYGYVMAGFAILALIIMALRIFEARQKKKRGAAKH